MANDPSQLSFAITRRSFLATAIPGAAWVALGSGASEKPSRPERKLHNKKGIRADMLPQQLSTLGALKLLGDSGFEQVEMFMTFDESIVRQNKSAARAAGISIGSVEDHLTNWRYPLSSSDPEAVEKTLAAQGEALRQAHFYGAEATLVIPGVVKPNVSYRSARIESRKHIELLIPLAEKLKIAMALEEGANQSKFLLSPLEFAQYIDDFKSPYVKAYFDVANIMPIGYPQDWIHALGKRIAKVHIKDYDPKTRKFVMLGDGAVDWPAVRQAFIDVGYTGTFTAELPKEVYLGLGPEYLREISQRMDQLLLS